MHQCIMFHPVFFFWRKTYEFISCLSRQSECFIYFFLILAIVVLVFEEIDLTFSKDLILRWNNTRGIYFLLTKSILRFFYRMERASTVHSH